MNTVHREMEDAGWRGKVGWITPPAGSLDPFEFLEIAPPGFRVIPTMTYVPGFTEAKGDHTAARKAAVDQVEQASTVLKGAGVDIITQSGSALMTVTGGLSGAQAIQATVEDNLGIPLVLMGLAMLNAAHEFGYRRAAVAAAAYDDSARDGYGTLLEQGGIEIVGIENWVQQGIFRTQEEVHRAIWPLHSRFTLGMSYKGAVSIARSCPDADCLFIMGGVIPILPIIEALEQDLGMPVITSVGAQFWEIFRRLGAYPPIHGYGSLLSSLERAL